jgi:hypothetical protein
MYLMMFSNSLRMNKTDRNMLELWHIYIYEIYFNIDAFVGFIVWNDLEVFMF